MKWLKKYPEPDPRIGTTRVVKQFLFLPKCLPQNIDNVIDFSVEEYRWFQFSNVRQMFSNILGWHDLYWENDK